MGPGPEPGSSGSANEKSSFPRCARYHSALTLTPATASGALASVRPPPRRLRPAPTTPRGPRVPGCPRDCCGCCGCLGFFPKAMGRSTPSMLISVGWWPKQSRSELNRVARKEIARLGRRADIYSGCRINCVAGKDKRLEQREQRAICGRAVSTTTPRALYSTRQAPASPACGIMARSRRHRMQRACRRVKRLLFDTRR